MKSRFLIIILCMKLSVLESISVFLRKTNSTIPSKLTKIIPLINKRQFELEEKRINSLQQKLKDYIRNPDQFLSSNSNKDIFIALFSNFTHMNGEILYNQYIQDRHNKDIQNLIDRLNNFQSSNSDKWFYNTLSNKFSLPDDIRSFSDYYKWKLIISLMKTMDKFPIIKNMRSSNKHYLFPEDIKIMNPPI